MILPSKLTRTARNLAIGAIAITAAAAAVPAAAHGAPDPGDIAYRLDRIEWQVDHLRDIHRPHARAAEIDRLQHQLYRLERVSDRQHGHVAWVNGQRIDRLQHKLGWLERRTERQLDQRYSRSDGPYDYRRIPTGTER